MLRNGLEARGFTLRRRHGCCDFLVPAPLALAGTFGQEHFGGCELGDKRLTKRAVVTADALLRHPDGTLPAKLATAQLLGFYDLANNPKVTHTNGA